MSPLIAAPHHSMSLPGSLHTTPVASPAPVSAEDGSGDLSVRPMRVKVLYTFDDQNKTNCLARWPHEINVQTAQLDENTLIGVIELKTCIQAIVSASPELVAKLGQDYTVYAYDYSEYETPLVGQGMLSWVLASASTTPSAPAHQSSTMVTGRVCKNILGFFSNGARETLEVKLRLVPVPTCLQSEYINSMEKYRELSRSVPANFDANAWTTFLKANPGFGQAAMGLVNSGTGQVDGQQRDSGIDIHQILTRGIPGQQTAPVAMDGFQGDRPSPATTIARPPTSMDMSGPSRVVTPAPNPVVVDSSDSVRPTQSRPSSRTAKRKDPPVQENNSTLAPVSDADIDRTTKGDESETGNGKKRARIMKADWQGKSSFGSKTESLRVTASAAASIRVHRPTPIRPGMVGQDSLQEPPRAPTPRPRSTRPPKSRKNQKAPSDLRNESADHRSPSYVSPYPPLQEGRRVSQDIQDGSLAGSPVDIASSPPVFEDSPGPSSPALPAMPQDIDSGFMSGGLDEDQEMNNPNIASRGSKQSNSALANRRNSQQGQKPSSELTFNHETPGPPDMLPVKILPRGSQDLERKRKMTWMAKQGLIDVNSDDMASVGGRATSLTRTQSLSFPGPSTPYEPQTSPAALHRTLSFPEIPASDPITAHSDYMNQVPGLRKLQPRPPPPPAPPIQPQVVAPVEPTIAPSKQAKEGGSNSISKPRSGSRGPRSGGGAKRKKIIQDRLASSIAAGTMPPFCENCGAIETPTWRKAYFKFFEGAPDEVELPSNDDGSIVMFDELQRDENGKVKSFKLIRKSLQEDEFGYNSILLCNPCGLWLNKSNCMRPQEIWDKEQPTRPKNPSKKKRPPKVRQQSSSVEGIKSEPCEIPLSAIQIDEVSNQSPAEAIQDQPEREGRTMTLSAQRRRAASLQPTSSAKRRKGLSNDAAAVALQRAIQSSPVRFLGSQDSPIELDPTPNPTRRLLFESPRHPGEVKTLDATSRISGTGRTDDELGPDLNPQDAGTTSDPDKENRRPIEEVATFDHLFEEQDDELERPTTPTPTSRAAVSEFKTPARMTPGGKSTSPKDIFCSAAAKNVLLAPCTPEQRRVSPMAGHTAGTEMTPFTAQLHQLLSETNGSPSGTHIDFSTLPSLNPNTPGRNSPLLLQDFVPDDLLSTDIIMPSSPPAFFSLYEDPVEPTSGLWSDYELPQTMHEPHHDFFGDSEDPTSQMSGMDSDNNRADVTVDFSTIIEEMRNTA